MYRRVISILFGAILPLAVTAEDAPKPITPEDLRAIIHSGDIDRVDRELSDAYDRFTRGDAHPDELRLLFSVFGKASPEVLDFTRDWLEAKPESPYAHTAQAWNDYHAAFIIRGERLFSDTYPDAISLFYQLHASAWEHASFAYEAEPRLLPASDALIRLGMTRPNEIESFEVLDEVMETDPNWGTLYRAIDATMPQWGGSWEMAEGMCDYYGPRLTELGDDPALHCKLYAAGNIHSSHGDPLFTWVQETLAENDIPSLRYLRLPQALSRSATREEAEFAYNYLSDLLENGRWDFSSAQAFDQSAAIRFDFPTISKDHYDAAIQGAKRKLEKNPYDFSALRMLRTRRKVFVPTDGYVTRSTNVDGPTIDEEARYIYRQLMVSPYDSALWSKYAVLKYPFSDPEFPLYRDKFLMNAVVYSNHNPFDLMNLGLSKARQLSLYEEHRRAAPSEDWTRVWDSLDIEADILCPLTRTMRIYALICDDNNDQACTQDEFSRQMVEKALAGYDAQKLCQSIYSAEIEDLVFEPVQVDFSDEDS